MKWPTGIHGWRHCLGCDCNKQGCIHGTSDKVVRQQRGSYIIYETGQNGMVGSCSLLRFVGRVIGSHSMRQRKSRAGLNFCWKLCCRMRWWTVRLFCPKENGYALVFYCLVYCLFWMSIPVVPKRFDESGCCPPRPVQLSLGSCIYTHTFCVLLFVLFSSVF